MAKRKKVTRAYKVGHTDHRCGDRTRLTVDEIRGVTC